MIASLSVDAVRAFIKSRPVELVFSKPRGGEELCLQAQYDGEGDFFHIRATDIEFVHLPGGLELEDIQLGTFQSLIDQVEDWTAPRGTYDGPALLFRGYGGDHGGRGHDVFILAADELTFVAGPDWQYRLGW